MKRAKPLLLTNGDLGHNVASRNFLFKYKKTIWDLNNG